ncbi:MAG TPA: VCBS repeat-containing protein [Phycisphaerales bacterium]|nr:VCBS repeat-containing protein [Phycisphaerales bacterium]
MQSKLSVRLSAASVLAICGSALAQIPFSTPTSLPAIRPSMTAIADFDGDGDNDLAVTTDTPDAVSFFINNGNGGFAAGPTLLTGPGTGPEGIAATDFDGDGDNDLVVVLQNINSARVFLNQGGMTFISGGGSATVGADARGLTRGDVDNDGDLDFVTANRDSNNVTIIRDMGSTLAATNVPSGGIEPRLAALGDLDNDGDLDLAVTNHDSPNITVFSNTAGVFTLATTISVGGTVRPNGITIANVNTGLPDLIVTLDDDDLGLNFVSVFTNNGGFSFSGPANIPSGGSNPDMVAAADFDLDGDIDLAVTNQDSGTLVILRNNGAGTFTAQAPIGVGINPEHLAVGLLDNNATPDIVVAARDSNAVFVLLNQTPTAPPCPADRNGDGQVTTADISTFLSQWFSDIANGTLVADFNQSGTVTTADVSAFLNAWFTAVSGGGCR